MVVLTCNLSTWEVKTGESRGQGKPGKQVQGQLDYKRPCPKEQKETTELMKQSAVIYPCNLQTEGIQEGESLDLEAISGSQVSPCMLAL